ncbi:hypothetical protein HIM_09263 [Hirsutella minnesotensis 3608]|uniref:HAT C-terminal dimerisation domain-containing protein n=1 Tax=Hirsutella minnesotensis 3608 TaxID=1043627 RepID=A0A0F7ZXU4_9HYPO|nr:hypothetical protein HIM_09263 [Hirsutella minnesotensis 3608]
MIQSPGSLKTANLTPPTTPSPEQLASNDSSERDDGPKETESGDEAMLRHLFRGWALSERSREIGSWAWSFGYDIQKENQRRWVCRACIRKKDPCPGNFDSDGIQNAYNHLFNEHGIRAPANKTKGSAEKKASSTGLRAQGQKSIVEVMKLDLHNPREQAIANALIKCFDRGHFQRLLMNWIVARNHSFSIAEENELREIFQYLNPSVALRGANLTHTTIKEKVAVAFEQHKHKVIEVLRKAPGLIHISFDGPARRRSEFQSLVLVHRGSNIAAEILDVIEAYGIQDKIGYFTLDNAENNDTAMEIIGAELGFIGRTRRGRCFGHTLNLSAKSILFGHKADAFERQLSGCHAPEGLGWSGRLDDSEYWLALEELVRDQQSYHWSPFFTPCYCDCAPYTGQAPLSEAEHLLWQKRGPVGKLHNLVVFIHRSDRLTYLLREIQQTTSDQSSDSQTKAKKPLDVVVDNDTRWLSQLHMIRRALLLRDSIELLVARHRIEFEQQRKSKSGLGQKIAKTPFICEAEHQLSDKDWEVLEIFAQILGYYECTIKMLEGDGQIRQRKRGWVGSYGNIWDVVQGFEFLLGKLESYKTMAERFPDPEHFRININLGWEKLDKYYQLLSDTPIYYAGLALHPAYRWKWFDQKWVDNPGWIRQAKKIVHDVWHYEYQGIAVSRGAVVEDTQAPKRRKTYSNPFQEFLEESRCAAPNVHGDDSLELFEDKYQHWISKHDSGDAQVRDPLAYWHEKRFQYPRLSRMALDFLTIQPMSAECERLFSAAGQMVTPLRSRLEAQVIGECQVLRSWLRAGIIRDLDPFFVSVADEKPHAKIVSSTNETVQEWNVA